VTARTLAWVLAAAVAVYLVFTVARSWVLIASGDPVPMLLGVSVIVIPLIGAWVLWRELAFGLRTQTLGRELGSEGLRESSAHASPRAPSLDGHVLSRRDCVCTVHHVHHHVLSGTQSPPASTHSG
jgi:ABC-type nickel/cobalt efflux system permease component RcnA